MILLYFTEIITSLPHLTPLLASFLLFITSSPFSYTFSSVLPSSIFYFYSFHFLSYLKFNNSKHTCIHVTHNLIKFFKNGIYSFWDKKNIINFINHFIYFIFQLFIYNRDTQIKESIVSLLQNIFARWICFPHANLSVQVFFPCIEVFSLLRSSLSLSLSALQLDIY